MKAKLSRIGKKRTHKVLKRTIICTSLFTVASLSLILPLSLKKGTIEEEKRDVYEQAFSSLDRPLDNKNIIYFFD